MNNKTTLSRLLLRLLPTNSATIQTTIMNTTNPKRGGGAIVETVQDLRVVYPTFQVFVLLLCITSVEIKGNVYRI